MSCVLSLGCLDIVVAGGGSTTLVDRSRNPDAGDHGWCSLLAILLKRHFGEQSAKTNHKKLVDTIQVALLPYLPNVRKDCGLSQAYSEQLQWSEFLSNRAKVEAVNTHKRREAGSQDERVPRSERERVFARLGTERRSPDFDLARSLPEPTFCPARERIRLTRKMRL